MILSDRFHRSLGTTQLSKKYIFLAVLYGLSTLIVPLATQFLVNSLALSSIFANTFIFLVILLVLLSLAQVLRYGQIVILEFIQRELFVSNAKKWMGKVKSEKSHYMLEIQTLMKSFSIAYAHLVELGLSVLFGFIVIISFHPGMLVLPLITGGAFWWIFQTWDPAVRSSVEESNVKYALVEKKFDNETLTDPDLAVFLKARDQHFVFIKRTTVIVSIAFVLSQLFLLGTGIFLIELAQLSVGQLVSAEIILTGIMVSVTKLPKTMEALYDLDTSEIKLEKALGAENAY